MRPIPMLAHLAAAAALLSTACSSGDRAGPSSQQVAVYFSTTARTSPTVVRASSTSPLTQMTGTNTLVITKAQVVLKHIELATTETAQCAVDDDAMSSGRLVAANGVHGGHNGESECDEIRADPTIIDLPVDATVTSSVVTTVPAGTYKAFQALIHAVRGNSPGAAAFLAAHPTFAGVSVHVEGTWNGAPFTYDGHAGGMLQLSFDPPAVVGSTGLSITVNVDLGTWFVDRAGELIDPSSANAGGENEQLVAHNVHESFEAFEDENHDGHEDR